MQILTETTNSEAARRRINYSRSFYKGGTTSDNGEGITHSLVWDGNPKRPALYPLNSLKGSKQNIYLSHVITDEFLAHVDFSQVPPFNNAVIFSRPCSTVTFTLDFGVFNEWLRIVTPDGDAPSGYVSPPDTLQQNFGNLELEIKQVHVAYNQFSLNQKFLDLYISTILAYKISNLNQQSVEMHQIASPLKADSTNWSTILYNIAVPERIFMVFVSKKNRNEPKANPDFYSNLGVTKLSFNVLSSGQNRFNQNRTTSFLHGEKVVCTKTSEYTNLNVNEKY